MKGRKDGKAIWRGKGKISSMRVHLFPLAQNIVLVVSNLQNGTVKAPKIKNKQIGKRTQILLFKK